MSFSFGKTYKPDDILPEYIYHLKEGKFDGFSLRGTKRFSEITIDGYHYVISKRISSKEVEMILVY